jgi:hypothetical protein
MSFVMEAFFATEVLGLDPIELIIPNQACEFVSKLTPEIQQGFGLRIGVHGSVVEPAKSPQLLLQDRMRAEIHIFSLPVRSCAPASGWRTSITGLGLWIREFI